MLELMRLEETSVFAIVDANQFEGEMDIMGYVQMNYKDGKPYTRTFETHSDAWLKELNQAIREKEIALAADTKYIRHTLNLENIVIQYLREKCGRSVKIDVIRKLVRQITLKIGEGDLFFRFWDHYQLRDNNIEKLLREASHLKLEGEYVCIKNYFADVICYDPNTDVDSVIREIIREFIVGDKKK